MNHRILAVVVTYFPEKELLERNIDAFINEIDKILIWENTPEKAKNQYRYIDDSKVEYCGDGLNSISRGLNFAWRYARKNGYDYLLTMDQDSVLFHFEALKEYAFLHSAEMMIFGPTFSQSMSMPSLTAIRKEVIITSGMLIPIKVLDHLGGYNENFAIDGIDVELCLRANLQGFFSYQVNGCLIQQRYGQPLVKYRRGVKHVIDSYPAKRLRSILKAHVYLMRKYPSMSYKKRREIKTYLIKRRIKEILLFEDNKIPKCYNLVLGIIEGMLKR